MALSVFFFSSRRRHTRFDCDWSSDVCSSDLATFSGLSIDKVGTSYTLTATGAGSTTSAAFNITAGSATQLVFNVQPSTTTAGAAITPAVQVTAPEGGGQTAARVTGDRTGEGRGG